MILESWGWYLTCSASHIEGRPLSPRLGNLSNNDPSYRNKGLRGSVALLTNNLEGGSSLHHNKVSYAVVLLTWPLQRDKASLIYIKEFVLYGVQS